MHVDLTQSNEMNILAQKQIAEKTIWEIIKSVHASSPTREWVTLESRTLVPLVIKKDNENTVVQAILAVPQIVNGSATGLKAWGYLCWQWPSGRLLAMVDIRQSIAGKNYILQESDICEKSNADAIQSALDDHRLIPTPDGKLLELYLLLLTQFRLNHFCKLPVDKLLNTVPHDLLNAKNEDMNDPTCIIKPTNSHHANEYLIVTAAMISLEELIKDIGEFHFQKRLIQIHNKISAPVFSVAVVGEFNRGKSTSINRLLSEDILPIGIVPTTAMVTRVLYGNYREICRIYSDGHSETVGWKPDIWDQFTAKTDQETCDGVLQITLPNQWLQKTGIQFLDTPGVNDLSSQRAALALEAITVCDATLIVIDATMALSLTEKTFIEDHIFAQHVPKVGVIVTHLDRVQETDRKSVLSHIKNKLLQWNQDIPLCIVYGEELVPANHKIDILGAEALWRKLADWASRAEMSRLRVRQASANLKAIVDSICGYLSTKREALLLSATEREKKLKAMKANESNASLQWEEARLDVKERARNGSKWLTEKLFEQKEIILEKLRYELRHSPNPKEWAEKDLPFRVRMLLSKVIKGIEIQLQQKIASDALWLNQMLKGKKLIYENIVIYEAAFDNKGLEIPQIDIKVSNLNDIKLMSRMGVGATTISTYLLFGPLGMAVSIGGGIIAERMIGKKIEEQKQTLDIAINGWLSDVFQTAINQVQNRMQSLYSRMIDECEHQKKEALISLQSALKIDSDSDVTVQIETINKQFLVLQQIKEAITNKRR